MGEMELISSSFNELIIGLFSGNNINCCGRSGWIVIALPELKIRRNDDDKGVRLAIEKVIKKLENYLKDN